MKYLSQLVYSAITCIVLLLGHPNLTHAAALPVEMKVLVLAADTNDISYLAISTALQQLGVPYQTIFVNSLTPDRSGNVLSSTPLIDTNGQGLYQGIIQTDGSFSVCTATACNSKLSASDWNKISSYALIYGVRTVAYYTYPTSDWGLQAADGGAGYGQTNPLNVTLTSAGASVFSYLNPANPLSIGGQNGANIWAYKATPVAAANETTTSLLASGNQTVAVLHKLANGRELMALTMDNYPGLSHTEALSYGVINWVTKGVFIGSRRVYLNPQIDDLLLGNRLYAPTRPECPNLVTCPTAFATGQDLRTLSAWQKQLQADPQFSTFKTTWAFNGIGTTWFPATDPIFSAISDLRGEYYWLNHTWDHSNLDCFSRDANNTCVPANVNQSLTELQQDIAVAPKLNMPLSPESMVTPYNGGLENASFLAAAIQSGIKYIVTADVEPAVPNTGLINSLNPGIYEIFRVTPDLFDNVSSPLSGVDGSWPDEYNAQYGPSGQTPLYPQNLTYSQIIDVESDKLLKEQLLTFHAYPLAFHIANSSLYDGAHSMYTDLLDATISKYKKLYTLPVLTLAMKDIGALFQGRDSFLVSGVTGVYTPGSGVVLKTTKAATIPVTGACKQAPCTTYGGQAQDFVSVPANTSVRLTLQN